MAKICVAYLDRTGMYNVSGQSEHFQKMFEKYVKKIFDCYIFDPRRAVNCCELTPSWELKYITSVCDWMNDEESFDSNGEWQTNLEFEKFRDEMDDFLIEANLEENWIYIHCNSIPSHSRKRKSSYYFPKKGSAFVTHYKFGKGFEYDKDDKDRDRACQFHDYIMEEAEEYFRCNSI